MSLHVVCQLLEMLFHQREPMNWSLAFLKDECYFSLQSDEEFIREKDHVKNQSARRWTGENPGQDCRQISAA
jgi:hypothetical protein